MSTIAFYLGALLIFILGCLSLKNTSPYTRAGGAKFEKRTKRKLLGLLLIVVAGIFLVMAIIAQIANTP